MGSKSGWGWKWVEEKQDQRIFFLTAKPEYEKMWFSMAWSQAQRCWENTGPSWSKNICVHLEEGQQFCTRGAFNSAPDLLCWPIPVKSWVIWNSGCLFYLFSPIPPSPLRSIFPYAYNNVCHITSWPIILSMVS